MLRLVQLKLSIITGVKINSTAAVYSQEEPALKMLFRFTCESLGMITRYGCRFLYARNTMHKSTLRGCTQLVTDGKRSF